MKGSHPPSRARIVVTACCLILTGASWVQASGPRWGSLVAEPLGLTDVDITNETLTIDLRPLTAGERAQVDILYRLHNPGAERKLSLVFPASLTDLQVWLGDALAPGEPIAEKERDAAWQPPAVTPGIDGAADVSYASVSMIRAVRFALTLSPGAHTLQVRYQAAAQRNPRGSPTVYWQLAYVLKPGRAWARFGGLDVTVHLPADWLVASSPALTRAGDKLHGRYDALPADALALTVQAPAGQDYYDVRHTGRVLLALAMCGGPLLCFFVCFLIGRWCGSLNCVALLAILAGVACAIGVLAAGVFVVEQPLNTLPPAQASKGAFRLMPPLLGAGLFFLVGSGSAAGAALWARRRARPQQK